MSKIDTKKCQMHVDASVSIFYRLGNVISHQKINKYLIYELCI